MLFLQVFPSFGQRSRQVGSVKRQVRTSDEVPAAFCVAGAIVLDLVGLSCLVLCGRRGILGRRGCISRGRRSILDVSWTWLRVNRIGERARGHQKGRKRGTVGVFRDGSVSALF